MLERGYQCAPLLSCQETPLHKQGLHYGKGVGWNSASICFMEVSSLSEPFWCQQCCDNSSLLHTFNCSTSRQLLLVLWLHWLFLLVLLLFLITGSLTALIKSHTVMKSKRHNAAFNRLTIPCTDWQTIFLKERIFSKTWMVQFRKKERPNRLSNHKTLPHGVWILALRTTSEDLWSLLLCSHF